VTAGSGDFSVEDAMDMVLTEKVPADQLHCIPHLQPPPAAAVTDGATQLQQVSCRRILTEWRAV